MKYLSLDIETTGLDPRMSNVLQIACVVEDTSKDIPVHDLPSLNVYVKQASDVCGSLVAFDMNRDLIHRIVTGDLPEGAYSTSTEDYAWNTVALFVGAHFGTDKAVIAGKNVAAFDMQFMPPHVKALFHHRTLDPAALYVDWTNDTVPPGLDTCLKRADVVVGKRHDALEDARDVVRALRPYYGA